MTISAIRNTYTCALSQFFSPFDMGLISGTVIGSSVIYKDASNYSMLATVGLTHVVVISGYNLSLVRRLFSKFVRSRFVIYFILFAYILLCGFSPPVLRAYIQLFVLDISSKLGLKLGPKSLLLLVFIILDILFPSYLSSKSNYLSFLATYGIMWMGRIMPLIQKPTPKLVPSPINRVVTVATSAFRSIFNNLKDTFYETLFAQLFTWPFISYYFGRFSLISFVVNPLVLWTIPFITILGFMDFFVSFLFPNFLLIKLCLLPITQYVFYVCKIFSQVPYASVALKINTITFWIYTIGIEMGLNYLSYRSSAIRIKK